MMFLNKYAEMTVDKSTVDVVIVGAGIIGVSCAYHLKKLSPDLKIILLDKHSRTLSVTSSNSTGGYVFMQF